MSPCNNLCLFFHAVGCPRASAVAAVGSTRQSGWKVPACAGAAHQAGPERLDRPAPSSAEHPGDGAGAENGWGAG